MGLFCSGHFRPSKCFHHATPDLVDARGSREVSFGSASSAPPTIWQNFQAHPNNQLHLHEEDEQYTDSWRDESFEDAGDMLQFDEADDFQNSILWASIKKGGFSFLDVLCSDDAGGNSKDPEVVAARSQCRAASSTDAGRALSALSVTVAEQLREHQVDAAKASVLACHYLQHHPHAAAYFEGELALKSGHLSLAAERFTSALAGHHLPQPLLVNSRIGLAAALLGSRQENESTNQLRSALKIFPQSCDLLLACAQHVLVLGRSKDEAEALLQYAINVQPGSIAALLAMSRFQLAYRHAHSASLSFADKALQLNPTHADSLLQRAIAHAAAPQSRPDDTLPLLRQAASSPVCMSLPLSH
jgi:tetratricopeptide (TPR) repeat protein